MFINKTQVLFLALFCLLNYSFMTETLARDVTVYPHGVDPTRNLYRSQKPQSVLDVRKTTFFTIERTVFIEDDGAGFDGDDYDHYRREENFDYEEGEEGMVLGTEIDVFAWKSVQRVVFTLTNPVETH